MDAGLVHRVLSVYAPAFASSKLRLLLDSAAAGGLEFATTESLV